MLFVNDEKSIFTSGNGDAICYDAATGKVLWKTSDPTLNKNLYALDPTGQILVGRTYGSAGDYDHRCLVWGIDVTSGEYVTHVTTIEKCPGWPYYDGGSTLIVPHLSGHLFAYNVLSNFSVAWEFDVPYGASSDFRLIGMNGDTVYAAVVNDYFNVSGLIEVSQDGMLRWSIDVHDLKSLTTLEVASDDSGILVATVADRSIVIDGKQGKVLLNISHSQVGIGGHEHDLYVTRSETMSDGNQSLRLMNPSETEQHWTLYRIFPNGTVGPDLCGNCTSAFARSDRVGSIEVFPSKLMGGAVVTTFPAGHVEEATETTIRTPGQPNITIYGAAGSTFIVGVTWNNLQDPYIYGLPMSST